MIINRHTSCCYGCLLHSALFHTLKHLALARIWVRTQDSMDQGSNGAWQFLRSCFVGRGSQLRFWFVCFLNLLPCFSLHIMTEEASHQAVTASRWQSRSYLGPGLHSQVASTELQEELMEQCKREKTEPATALHSPAFNFLTFSASRHSRKEWDATKHSSVHLRKQLSKDLGISIRELQGENWHRELRGDIGRGNCYW